MNRNKPTQRRPRTCSPETGRRRSTGERNILDHLVRIEQALEMIAQELARRTNE